MGERKGQGAKVEQGLEEGGGGVNMLDKDTSRAK